MSKLFDFLSLGVRRAPGEVSEKAGSILKILEEYDPRYPASAYSYQPSNVGSFRPVLAREAFEIVVSANGRVIYSGECLDQTFCPDEIFLRDKMRKIVPDFGRIVYPEEEDSMKENFARAGFSGV